MTQRAIVLAAGRGNRQLSRDAVPKLLKPVVGIPMLVRLLRTLQGEGIREAVVVLGWEAEAIRAALDREPSIVIRLTFVENPEHEKKNGVSLLAAAPWVEEGCLLTMGDHLYSPEIVRRLRAFDLPADACVLAVDRDVERCFDLDDATKVKLSGGRVATIGKELETFDAVDTGVFRIGKALCTELARLAAERGDCSLSDGVGALARDGRLFACDVGEARWIDVDTPPALQRAEAMVHVFGDGLGDEPAGVDRSDPGAVELFAPSWVRAAEPYNEDHFEIAEKRAGVARLMSNESPFPPSERVLQAVMAAALHGNRYPSRARELRRRLAARVGLDEAQVQVGAGSAELIDLVIRSFVAPGEEVVISVPTFSMYEARTRTVGGIPVLVPMTEEGAFDVPGIISAVTERTKLLFLCTPNNPTGNRMSQSDVRRVLALGLPTLIDEAYYELSNDGESLAHLVAEHPNAIVLRTFSKAFGLAGLRVGYVLGHAAAVRVLSRVKVPWNVSSLAIAAAIASLDDMEEQEQRWQALRDGRTYLERELGAVPGLEVLPSEANFVLIDVSGTGLGADGIVERMLERGYFLRSLRSHRAGRSLVRITVGDEQQNRGCAQMLREVLAAHAPVAPRVPS
jgi:histidinol-phosphate aminotransferase